MVDMFDLLFSLVQLAFAYSLKVFNNMILTIFGKYKHTACFKDNQLI